jgi:hypothetical protein
MSDDTKEPVAPVDTAAEKSVDNANVVDVEHQGSDVVLGDVAGTSKIEGIKAVWGKHGRLLVILAYVIYDDLQ